MCACRQKKSFLIADILSDTKKKPYKNLSNEPSKPLICHKKSETLDVTQISTNEYKAYKDDVLSDKTTKAEENLTRFNVISEVHNELELRKVNLEHRRNTYPLHPTAVKPTYPWNYRRETLNMDSRMGFYSEQMLHSSHLLRSQLAAGRFASHPLSIRQPYCFDKVPPNCCSPWWGLGGRRKGGQVRFTAAQTGALERRFNASKYLSPDERRALAGSLRLSDRQVKTWFQNRRAKWRRTTPDSADVGSPPSSSEDKDDDVQITDDSA